MPIHLIWGDNAAAIDQEIDVLIKQILDPAWSAMNLSRLDGNDPTQAKQALEEVRSPPLGQGGRIVLLKRSPFLNNCTNEMANLFENTINLIPENSFLVLNNISKPDGRLKTTKIVQKLIKSNIIRENKFILPAIWDFTGQAKLVEETAKNLGLKIEPEALHKIVETTSNDSKKIYSELQKLALHQKASLNSNYSKATSLTITTETVDALLIDNKTTNSLKIGEYLLKENVGEIISQLDTLLDSGEPALRILSTLVGQVRGWLWVSLLELQGEKNVEVIAKAAGIGNPKRIYILRRQIQGKSPHTFIKLLNKLLAIEAALKKGAIAKEAFRDGLLTDN